ncbi:hypothetical protein [Nocardioides sp.]|uniref:hypothetical protein n=1 Tax=Nocardioides sp. TaxID=35761 RepID=UPI003565926A
MAIRHKRDTNARRTPKAAYIAGPLAALATGVTVTLGVAGASPEAALDLTTAAGLANPVDISDRSETVSRDSSRERAQFQRTFDKNMERTATMKAIRRADTKLWTTAPLNLWTDETKKAKKLGVIKAGKKVLVTGRSAAGRNEIVLDGKTRWVTKGYLSESKPVSSPGAPAASANCTNGTSVPSGVSPNIAAVHQAVCAAFPEIGVYGTFRGDGEHAQGRAIDIMVSGSRGWQVAEFVRANYSALGVSYLIYSQRIWSVERSAEGWRGMSDRGSTTANHYDHVHVTTY